MMALTKFLLAILLFEFGSSQNIGVTPWDTINTTFPYFYSVPLTEADAIAKGWKAILQCGDEGSPGNVYWVEGDFSTMPIFNADGNMSGIIVGVEDPGKTQHGRAPWVYYEYKNSTNATKSFYGIEGIFRDPDTICDSGSAGDAKIGDRLWIANGTQSQYSKIPLNESYCLLERQGWNEGGCKDGIFKMGVHYWRYNEVDTNCNDSYPVFILYDNHILHAWGVAMGNTDRPYTNETRWEHPEGSFLTSFFLTGEAPTCLAAQSKVFNSLHVYMTSSVIAEATACGNETDHQASCNTMTPVSTNMGPTAMPNTVPTMMPNTMDNMVPTMMPNTMPNMMPTDSGNDNNNNTSDGGNGSGSKNNNGSSTDTLAIVFGVLGGIAVIAIVLVAYWQCCRKDNGGDDNYRAMKEPINK